MRYDNFQKTTFLIMGLLLLQMLLLCNCTNPNEPIFPSADQNITFNLNEQKHIGTVNDYSYNITLTKIELNMLVDHNESLLTFSTNAGEFTFNANANKRIELLFDNGKILILDIQGIYKQQNKIETLVYYSGIEL